MDIKVMDIKVMDIKVMDIKVMDIKVMDIKVMDIKVMDIKVMDIKVMDIKVMDIKVMDIKVMDIKVMDIKVMDIKELDILANDGRSSGTQAIDREYVPPDSGYGWVCVVCVFMVNAHTWGLNFAYGVFLDYFLAEGLYPNASPFDYALIGGLSVSMALIITPLINTSTRKLGTRPTLSIGLALFTASLIGASFATEVWHLYLSQGVCIGWGTGFLYVGSANIIPQWFSRRRSLANGICASGAGFGGLIYSLATSALLQRAGPPLTFRVLAACQFVANLVSIILISDRNQTQRPNQSAFNYRLLKRGEVWLVLGWGCMSELGYTVLLFSLPNYARSIGLNAKQGSVVAALLNLSTFFGRILLGHSSDVLGRINITSITTGFCGTICLVIWIFAKSFAVLCFFAVLAGMVCGAFWATVAPVAADVTGLSELPSTLSIVLVLMVIPATSVQNLVRTASQLLWTKQSSSEEAVYLGKGLIRKSGA
ncbi:MAG: hypothetical protein OHK93_007388 [Ramalina farinacea]|uniref:Uncharacterized protein n=1 Tax=Ramalina farinacea TaxID=258253 RepID=A0AA43TUB9_9LECA|nr:hypothetical protein [Ramalina farinacea]